MFKILHEELYRLEVQVDLFWSKQSKQVLEVKENITETRTVINHCDTS